MPVSGPLDVAVNMRKILAGSRSSLTLLAHRRFVSTVNKPMRAMIPGIRHQRTKAPSSTPSVDPLSPQRYLSPGPEVLAGTLSLSLFLSPLPQTLLFHTAYQEPPLSFAEILPRSRAYGQYYRYRVLKGPPLSPGVASRCHMVVSLSGYHGGAMGIGCWGREMRLGSRATMDG